MALLDGTAIVAAAGKVAGFRVRLRISFECEGGD
jgi:hypothetical protein